jgi:hypothetical protein
MFQRHGSSSFTFIAASALALACWPSSSWAQDLCFQDAASIGTGLTPSWFAAGDLDADGDNEVVFADTSAFYVAFNNGNGTFAAPVVYSSFLAPMAVVDLNGDGARDVVGLGTGATIAVALNQGNGTLGAPSNYPTGNGATRLVTGDLDGDGDLDIATTNSQSLTQSVLLNQGTGTFGAPTVYATAVGQLPSSPASIDLALGDLEGDGDFDLVGVVADRDTGLGHYGSHSYLTIRRNLGNGTFAAVEQSTLGGVPWTIALDDFDGDGDPDLAIADQYFNRTWVYVNSGNGTFGAAAGYNTPNGSQFNEYPVYLDSADMDGDGDPDLVAKGTAGVRVLTNNGSGAFVVSTEFQIGWSFGNMLLANVLGDSRPEVLARTSGSSGSGLTVAKSCQTTGGSRYCFGDGLGAAACPCQNPSGELERGCANLLYLEGAQLSATGTSSVSSDTLVLKSTEMSGAQSWYFQATGQDAIPFGRGILCVSGALLRVGQKSVVGGSSINPSGTDLPLSIKGAIPPSGGTRYYQVSYRQANPVCTPAPTSNTNRTNGLAIVWTP